MQTLKSSFNPFHFEEVKIFDFAAGALASHKWAVVTDEAFGGSSTATFEASEEGNSVPPHQRTRLYYARQSEHHLTR